MSKVKVLACSGIGKVYGLMAREAMLHVTQELSPDKSETLCLAHVITDDVSMLSQIKGASCITIDGCPAMCAAKSVENAGGIVKEKFRSVDEMRNHRGVNAGNGSNLTPDGWLIVEELARKVANRVNEVQMEDQNNVN